MAIVLEQVRKSYGDQLVLDGISRTIAIGSCIALMGPSGIGKTTLLSLLAGLQSPDFGRITGLPKQRAMVFQENRLIEHANALTNLKLVCGAEYTREVLIEELKKIGIEDVQKPIVEFSGGMKRRVAILRAVLAEAKLLLMDEPFLGLDAERKTQVMEYVKAHCAGKTVVLVTHEEEEAKALGAEIWYLK
ncbi:MAG: ABC transporter ATP-binding protein [Lachnospiraceae bacterium]|nr:ABC transporter ATP-binding protein [Lachnospiraceae bacterium]